MKAIRNLLLVFAVAYAVGPLNAHASSSMPDAVNDKVWHPCGGCTLTQAFAKASALGYGNHFVYDLPGNHFYYFSVECESGTCYANQITPPSDATYDFGVYHQGYIQFHTEAFHADINYYKPSGSPHNTHGDPEDDGYVNAFDSLEITQLEDPLLNELQNGANYTGVMATIITVLANGIGYTIPSWTMVVTVHFHDGSSRIFTFNQDNVKFAGVINSARDSEGNPLYDPGHEPRTHQFLFDGPNGRPYNLHNVATILNADPYPEDDGTVECAMTVDGDGTVHLTCVVPP
jgi:hypothetical protein